MRRLAVTITVLALLLSACAGDDTPEVVTAPDEPIEAPEAPEDDEDETDDDVREEPDDAADDEAVEDDEAGTDGDTDGDTPTPDAAALDDPCGDHQDREGEAFIELVAPVDDQQADGDLDLVGCSSVPEGTIQYRLLDGDGATLDEGFTTAECGGPCIGEFRETVSLDSAAGEPVVYVQVFWEDLSDGSDRDLEERIVVLG